MYQSPPKHNGIRVLAESELNTILDYVSTALSDGPISNQESQLILSEIEKYNKMKDEIRTKTHRDYDAVILDEKTKNSLIQHGRDEAEANFIKKVGFTKTLACHCVSKNEEKHPPMYAP